MGEAATPDAQQGQPEPSQSRFALPHAVRRFGSPSRPSAFIAALVVLAVAVIALGGLSYLGANEFTRRAANDRGADEARSLASHSSKLATGDAFNGYLQILRYADDPIVRSQSATEAERTAALLNLTYLNTNRMASLTIANRAGNVLATTDASIDDVRLSEAFAETRANLGPANSDIILPDDGRPAFVDFTSPIKDASGSTWGILVGRIEPPRLWTQTLNATVDGSRNVLLNNEGRYSAGVPDDLIGQPWRGRQLDNGSVRADIAGVDSICGLGPIGLDTQIDHGWSVASCLPATLMQADQQAALGRQLLVTLAGAVLVFVVGAGALRIAIDPKPPLLMLPAPLEAGLFRFDAAPAESSPAHAEPGDQSEAADPLQPTIQPAFAQLQPEPEFVPVSVEARRVIEAYEQRNARLSARLREIVQARLLVASSEADEAYKLASVDEALAENLHGRAMQELEGLRERELRAIGQELHPGLVRLGLPAALRALRKDLADIIELRLDIDQAVDTVDAVPVAVPQAVLQPDDAQDPEDVASDDAPLGIQLLPDLPAEPAIYDEEAAEWAAISAEARSADRQSLDGGQRIVIYRLVLEAARALAAAGARECAVSVRRESSFISIAVEGSIEDSGLDPASLAATIIAVEAYGGRVSVGQTRDRVAVAADFPAAA